MSGCSNREIQRLLYDVYIENLPIHRDFFIKNTDGSARKMNMQQANFHKGHSWGQVDWGSDKGLTLGKIFNICNFIKFITKLLDKLFDNKKKDFF